MRWCLLKRRSRAARKRRVARKIVNRIIRTQEKFRKRQRDVHNRFARKESFAVAEAAAQPGQTIALDAYGLWQVTEVTRYGGKCRCRQCGEDQVFVRMADTPSGGLWCWVLRAIPPPPPAHPVAPKQPSFCYRCDPDD